MNISTLMCLCVQITKKTMKCKLPKLPTHSGGGGKLQNANYQNYTLPTHFWGGGKLPNTIEHM